MRGPVVSAGNVKAQSRIAAVTFPGLRCPRLCVWVLEIRAVVLKKSFVFGKLRLRRLRFPVCGGCGFAVGCRKYKSSFLNRVSVFGKLRLRRLRFPVCCGRGSAFGCRESEPCLLCRVLFSENSASFIFQIFINPSRMDAGNERKFDALMQQLNRR